MAQVALAWLLARGDNIMPIPGTKRRKYLEENAAAVDITLSDAEVKALEQAFPPQAAAGLRYPGIPAQDDGDLSKVDRLRHLQATPAKREASKDRRPRPGSSRARFARAS